MSHWAFLVAIFCLLRHTDNKKSFLFPRITLCTSCTLQHVALTLLYPSLLSSSCNLTNILLSFTDWMSNPFDRVVCGDFAGKKMQFKKMFCFEPFLKNYCAIKISKSIFLILRCCQQTIKKIDMGSGMEKIVYRILILTQTPTVKMNSISSTKNPLKEILHL